MMLPRLRHFVAVKRSAARRAFMTWDAAAVLPPPQEAFIVKPAWLGKPAWLSLEAVTKKIAERPWAFATFITGAKTFAADYLTQRFLEKKKPSEIDWRRNAVFTLFGLGYLGGFQYVLWSRWFPLWFPGRSAKSAVACMAFDQTVNTGLWYYPCFYVLQDAVMKAKVEVATFERGFQVYKQNIAQDMVNTWKLWVPAQLINFSIVPIFLRAPYGASVSFVWCIILSFLRGEAKSI